MKKFKVIEIGTYFGSKEVEAETKDEANEKYFADPCLVEDCEFETTLFEVEEIKEVSNDDLGRV